MAVVTGKGLVSAAIMESRVGQLLAKHPHAGPEDLRRAAGFENGSVALSVRRKAVEKDVGGIADPRTKSAKQDRQVFSGLGGVSPSSLGITISEESFMESMKNAGMTEAMAEKAWNDLLLSRVEPNGVAQGVIMAGDSGREGSPFAIKGTMGIPCVTPVVAGDDLRFIVPTKAQIAAVDAIAGNAGRAAEWSGLRKQLSVEPITRGNELDRFFSSIAVHQRAPRLSKALLEMPTTTFNDAAPAITHAQGTMEWFTCMLTAFMIKTGLIFVPEENRSATEKITNYTGTAYDPAAGGNFAPAGTAEFAELQSFFYAGPSGFARRGDNATLVSNAISQAPIIADLLMPSSATAMSDPLLKTEDHFADASPATRVLMAEFRSALYDASLQGALQNIRSNAEGGVEARPHFKHFPGTIFDRVRGTYQNPAMDATSMTFRTSRFGSAAARMSMGAAVLASSVIMHGQEDRRLYAGKAIGDCSPGGLVSVRLA